MAHRYRERLAIAGLGLLMLISGDASAEDPIYGQHSPEWLADAPSGSMALAPPWAKVAVGLSHPDTALHVIGESVTSSPASGSVTIGPTNSLHMQMDQNDIQVSGSMNSTVGSLHFQRFGGPIAIHGSRPLADRLYITSEGDLGVGTADPVQFAVDRGLATNVWALNPDLRPPGLIAVDGEIYAGKLRTLDLTVRERVRVGAPLMFDDWPAAIDTLHSDAVLQVGGKLSAQSIVVHLDNWADDVFSEDYSLMPLIELEDFVRREQHLPGVPTTSEVRSTGLDLAKSNEVLLRKVEELTLHAIAQQKKIEELERKFDALAK